MELVCLQPRHQSQARALIVEYVHALGVDLSCQNFERELADFPRAYGGSTGAFLLALEGELAVGCVGLRRLDANRCELKRLYVREGHRGRGVGKALVLRIIQIACRLGYRAMLLDTLPTMVAAQRLYRSVGFVETPAYAHIPIEGTMFMEINLSADMLGLDAVEA